MKYDLITILGPTATGKTTFAANLAVNLKASINFYYTEFQDRIETKSFYHDGYHSFGNYAISGINKTHQGVEIAMEANITSTIVATAPNDSNSS